MVVMVVVRSSVGRSGGGGGDIVLSTPHSLSVDDDLTNCVDGWMDGNNSFVCEEHPPPTKPDQPVTRLGKSDVSRASSTTSNGFGRGQRWTVVMNRGVCNRRGGRNRLRVGRVRCV